MSIKRYYLGLQLSNRQFPPKCSQKFKSLKDNCLKGFSWKHSNSPLPTALFKQPCFAQKIGSSRSKRECPFTHVCLSLLNIHLVVILSHSCPEYSSELLELPTGLPPPCPLIIAKNSRYRALEEVRGSRSKLSTRFAGARVCIISDMPECNHQRKYWHLKSIQPWNLWSHRRCHLPLASSPPEPFQQANVCEVKPVLKQEERSIKSSKMLIETTENQSGPQSSQQTTFMSRA